MKRRTWALALALASGASLVGWTWSAMAQSAGRSSTAAQSMAAPSAGSFPDHPIRLIVPFSPGGGNDNVARTVGRRLGEILGQPIVVENRAGAGGTVGAETVARAPADGYTLFLGGVGSHAINPNLRKNLPYDAIKDFAPITLLAQAPMVLVAQPSLHIRTVPELIALARKEPGKLDYASNGNGSSSHLAAVMFATEAKVSLTHVPYKGLAPALTDLLSGQVPLMFSSVVAILPHIKDGSLVPLGVTGTHELATLPGVPTIASQGLSGYETSSWYGILAPAGTPQGIVMKLNAALNEALQDPKIRESLASDGAEPAGGTPAQFAAHIQREKDRLGAAIRESGLQME
ncbi:tripartite tricarboxylate transporter substrate binding protein [Bordetella sp. LUAb4]|uniref:tripartite tricarboxylate transporter substrate binding protein n=1 Tax=Bordetella sp. LUAb4 TaxID=2843195 RepID=UPI001E610EF2|nr:tripartite tricarboxylate transporter substrate binding protein [Bordetella sp. LUAb4]